MLMSKRQNTSLHTSTLLRRYVHSKPPVLRRYVQRKQPSRREEFNYKGRCAPRLLWAGTKGSRRPTRLMKENRNSVRQCKLDQKGSGDCSLTGNSGKQAQNPYDSDKLVQKGSGNCSFAGNSGKQAPTVSGRSGHVHTWRITTAHFGSGPSSSP